jgi:hypothetical protein
MAVALALVLTATPTTLLAESARCTVTAHEGRWSASIRSVPLSEAVAALATASGMRVDWISGTGHEPISVGFAGAGLAEAVARLLPHRSYLFVSGGHSGTVLRIGDLVSGREPPRQASVSEGAVPPLRKVSELDATGDRGSIAPDDAASEARRHQDLDTVAALAARLGEPGVQQGLLEMLDASVSPDVRAAAFASLREHDGLPTEALLPVAMRDGPPGLRHPAVEMLGERISSDPAAEAALTQLANGDADEAIQELAREALLKHGDPASPE